MIPEVMRAVTGQSFQSSAALLPRYERYCLVDKPYPGILQTGRHSTAGKVYLDLDDQSLQRLDYFEDDLYTRQTETVVLPDHSSLNANVYVVPSNQHHQVSQQVWSEEHFRNTHLTSFLEQINHWMRDYGHQP